MTSAGVIPASTMSSIDVDGPAHGAVGAKAYLDALPVDRPEIERLNGGRLPGSPVGHDMPFKSRAQRRKFAELLVKGEISPETFEEWNRTTGRKKLPERVKAKRRATRKRQKPRHR